ncbi:unnamed protein product [Phytophthora fragariaefolia]|uniref:Unnamed protein product n=1 Tax=Phytophthora fragariaefolia TaxID=1490495 RepID=A0A9W6YJ85_9STRA|nr:unnamed protein product [Phytophthora fragariaefolia]
MNLPETSMISNLVKMIPADRMMELAKKIPGSSKTIENLQYQYWLRMDKTPDEVKTLLWLDNLGAKMLDSPNLNIWIRFKRMYNQKHGIPNTA